jgi:hypothetical protein
MGQEKRRLNLLKQAQKVNPVTGSIGTPKEEPVIRKVDIKTLEVKRGKKKS